MGLLVALVAVLCINSPVFGGKGCSALRHLENGHTFFRYGGLLVIFRCRAGYKLHGYKTNSCVSGHWSRDTPVCVGSGCSSPGPLIHGTSSVNEDGSWAVFSCNSGFRLHGPSMLYCKGHNWNSSKPVCKESDMMSSVSGVGVQKPNQNLQSAVALKTQQLSHGTVTNNASIEANIKFDLSHMPPHTSNSESNKYTNPVVQLQQYIQFPSFKIKDGVQKGYFYEAREANKLQEPETGSGSNGSEAEATQIVASKFHKSTTVSSILSLVSGSTSPLPSFSDAQTPTITVVTNTAFTHSLPTAPTSPLHHTTSALLEFGSDKALKLKEPVTSQDDVTPSEDHLAQTGFQFYASLSQSGSEDKEEPTETSTPSLFTSAYFSLTSSSSSSSSSSSAHTLSSPLPSFSASTPSFTQSNMKTQLPDVTLPLKTSISTEPRSFIDLTKLSTSKPPLLSLSPSSHPVCPYPPVPAHGTLYFRNVENPGPTEYRYYAQYACYPGYTLAHGEKHSYCQQGGTWSGITPVCLDVDECLLPAAVTGCVFGCVNTLGSFHCQCPPGYSLQSADSHCQDIDECAVNQGLGPCMEQCHNSPGSYRCSCRYGHILAGNGHSCIAECPPGYRKHATPPENSTAQALREECLDINECQEESCEWQCVNLPGSYRCICPRGYTLQKDGRHCKDINECSVKNGGCSHLCVNQKGGHKCACPASHRLSPYSWKKCVPRTTANTAG